MNPLTKRLGCRSFMLIAIMTTAAVGCGSLEKVSEADVDTSQKAAAQVLGDRIFEGCRTGQHPTLTRDEAIPEMVDGLSPAKQTSTCSASNASFGDYQSMEYVETYKQRSLRVYRFKGHFSRTSDTPEIRVVMDSANKLSGLWLKPWQDALR